VWNTKDENKTAIEYCNEEAEHVETFALAACASLDMDFETSIIPIDYQTGKTRRRLAYSLLLHPIESLVLISRFHGRSSPTTENALSDISEWRTEFSKKCPTAYRILFTEREAHMASEIMRISSTVPQNSRIAIIVGVSHVEAIYEKLVDAVSP